VQGFSKTRYRLTHSPRVRTDDVLRNLSDLDTQLGIEAQVSRQLGFVAIDVPREDREFVRYQPQAVPDKNGFWVLIGYEQFTREPIWVNLADSTSPHILDAGVSGGGKTNKNASILQNIFDNYSVDDCEIWIIDTKNDELLTTCQSHPMVTRYLTDPDRAVDAFCQLEKIMIDRQKNRQDKHIFVLVEECADFTSKQGRFYKDSYVVLDAILRKGRSAKIHMMMSTQYPKNEVLPREMTSNMPVKVCHRVVYKQNSMTVLDMDYDASKFKGKGDGVVLLPEKGLVEFQAALLDGFRFEPCHEPQVQTNPTSEPAEPQAQSAPRQSEPAEPELEEWDGNGDIPPSWARFIVRCVQSKLNKKQTLEESIGLKKGGSPKYQKASDLYDLIKETIL